MERSEEARLRALVIAVLALVAFGAAVDLALDAPARWLTPHVLLELAVVGLSLAAIGYLAHRWWVAERSLADVRLGLERASAEQERWKRAASGAIAGFAAAIDAQFEGWELTPAEREVAFLLLRGASHKRIAAQTCRSERTVRQHAIAVYGKAGLPGRAQLSAFFLEPLLAAAGRDGRDAPSGGSAPGDAVAPPAAGERSGARP